MDTLVAYPIPTVSASRRPGRRAAWVALAVASALVGAVSLRYALPHVPFAPPLPNLTQRRIALSLHAISAATALIVGPWQFLDGVRMRRPHLHRTLGWIYLTGVAVGGLSALRLAPNAAGGVVSAWGFGMLSVLWIGSAAMALRRVIQRRIADHRLWMIRCFALTAGAITLRIQLPLSQMMGIPFSIAYPAISWLAWVPNLLAIEIWRVRRARR